MKSRYDKLIVVRGAASRVASSALAEAATHVAEQESLAQRLEDAVAGLSPEAGVISGSDLAARKGLMSRMQAAQQATQVKLDAAKSHYREHALTRRAARRALDAAVDIHRADARAQAARAEMRSVPFKPNGAVR